MRTTYQFTLCILFLLLPVSQALAGLTLYPTRVVFDGNQRAAQVELLNNGTETATYRISLVNRRMSETGAFSDIDEPLPGEQFADNLLRYSPRQVTLAPGKGQTVRIMVRKPANLTTGEYRSHLLFAKQPKARGRSSIETRNAPGDDAIEIKLTALVGVSIPVIVRQGNTDATVALTHLDLAQAADKEPTLALHMERSGSQSVYGDLTVFFTPHGGSEQVVARANGVAVYTPNSLRRASIKLDQPNGLQLSNGILRVIYREQAEGGGAVLAEAVLRLP
ncbi:MULTISPECIES: molecular chaperone [Marinobacter]|uniref:fimbrial biogenesis chaperone n=1 Tax=Marinobacter TaxID=2742 RepID=UPI001246A6B1|nr:MULTISPECIES: molecular chaperone [Marinobacter]MBL3555308.1 molecular chaperone [Marinobacter sp. JB05H06]